MIVRVGIASSRSPLHVQHADARALAVGAHTGEIMSAAERRNIERERKRERRVDRRRQGLRGSLGMSFDAARGGASKQVNEKEERVDARRGG